MKWIELLKTIKETRVSFIALIVFVGLSIGLFLGMNWSGPSVKILANEYYDDHGVMDLKAVSADGFKEKDIEQIRGIDDVSEAEGVYTADAFMWINGEKEIFSVISVTGSVNRAEVVEGELPDEPGEIAIDEVMAEKMYYSIGDTISLDSSLKELTGYSVSSLNNSRYRITAIVHYPEFTSSSKTAAKGYSAAYRRTFKYYALVDESAFNEDVYSGKYSAVIMRMKSLAGADRFGDEYSELARQAREHFKDAYEGGDSVSVTDITTTFGYYTVDVAEMTSSKIATIFASFFLAIGLLVCYSTILRLVEEEKRLIGTKMANGFTNSAVASKYMIYVFIAVTLGAVMGVSTAFMISASTQSKVTNELVFSGTYNYYDVKQILIMIALEYVVMLLIAWAASAKQMRKKITALLNNTKENSRLFTSLAKTSLVKKASVSVQSFVYNISMDSSRIIATIVGMAGSMALLIGPISLYLTLAASPQVQYNKIFMFDHAIQYADEESGERVMDILDESGSEYIRVYSEDAVLSRDGENEGSVRLIAVADTDDFKKMVNLIDPDNGSQMELDDNGVMIWQAEGKDYGTAAGDVMKVSSYEGDDYEFEVSGLYRCYDPASNRMFMTADVYEKVTGEDFEPNALLAAVSEETAEIVKDVDGVFSCSDEVASCVSSYDGIKAAIKAILGMVLVMSAIIAFLILLNLNIQFVNEKKMELIVMRINGFSTGAARMYIVRDNIFLSAVSAVIGVGTGILLGWLLINAMQLKGRCMLNSPSVPACLIGAGITMVYMIITNIIAIKPVSKLDLTDISKV